MIKTINDDKASTNQYKIQSPCSVSMFLCLIYRSEYARGGLQPKMAGFFLTTLTLLLFISTATGGISFFYRSGIFFMRLQGVDVSLTFLDIIRLDHGQFISKKVHIKVAIKVTRIDRSRKSKFLQSL